MDNNTITVLHVDDDPSFLDLAKLQFERRDEALSVVSECSAQDGLERLREGGIDCIVSDYEMSDMDGLEFLDAVRDEYRSLPFILYTGKGSEEIAERAINAGVDAYYQKEVGTGQYSVIAQHITTLAEQRSAKRRLHYLERSVHLADGGVQEAETTEGDEFDDTTSSAVISAVADREGVDPVALTPPLCDAIDPDALDALFPRQPAEADEGAQSVTFTYHGYTITVSDHGEVQIDE